MTEEKKLKDCTVAEIEEYLADILTDPEVDNLYMKCLICDEYVHISEIANFELETCKTCQEESEEKNLDNN